MRSSRRPELADSSGFNGMGSRSDDSYEVQRFLHEYDERFQEDLSLVPGDESSGYHRQQRGAYPQGRNQHVAPEHQHSAILYAPHPHHMPPYSIHRGILTSPVNFYQPEHPFAQANALTDRTEPWSSYNPRRASHQTVSGREVVFAVDDGQRYLHSPSKEPSLSLYRTGSGQSNTRRMSPLSSFGTSSVSSTAAQHHSNKQYSFDMILQSPTPGPEEQSRKAVRGCHSLTPLEVYCGLSWEEKTEGVTQNDSSQLGNGSPTSSYYSSTHPRDLGSGIEQAGIPVYGQPSHLQPGSFASDYRCSTVVGFQDHGHWTEQTGDMSYGPSLEVENRSITGNDSTTSSSFPGASLEPPHSPIGGSPAGSGVLSPAPGPGVDFLKCEICDTVFTGEHMKGNLARHNKTKHRKASKVLCASVGCQRMFKRQDSCLKHERNWHPELGRRPAEGRPQSRRKR